MMKTCRKIGIIGRIDPERRLYHGQTVKTRMMYQLLCETYGEDSIVTVDTYDYKHRAPMVIADFVRCLSTCDRLVVLLSTNGRRVFFPLLSFASNHMGKKVFHNLIGGSLASNLEKYPKWVKYLNSFEVNWVEAHALVERLSEKGVSNSEHLPNFKYFKSGESHGKRHFDGHFRFCTFSRVVEQKGIGDAAAAVEQLCSEEKQCFLDVYGPIDKEYEQIFDRIIESSPHVEYKGCVAPEESVGTLSCYDALLFPTKWESEGIPGTVIDALHAGVPVIASKWQYYDEMLEDGVTGFGYDYGAQDKLKAAIESFMSIDEYARAELSSNCMCRARDYSPESVKAIVCSELFA